jgi:hypothetical protein
MFSLGNTDLPTSEYEFHHDGSFLSHGRCIRISLTSGSLGSEMVTVRTTSTSDDDDVADCNVRVVGDRVPCPSSRLADAAVCQGTIFRALVFKSVAGAHRALTERLAHILLYQVREVRIVGARCVELAGLDREVQPSPHGPGSRGLIDRSAPRDWVNSAHAGGQGAVPRCARRIGTRRKRLHARALTSASIALSGGADHGVPHDATPGEHSR